MSTWRDRPNEIPDHEIAETVTGDVVVVGLGYSGAAAVRAAAEAGADVIGIELMNGEKFTSFGRDVGHINSAFLRSRGIPDVDPIDLYNEWMRRAGNRANPRLIMTFAQKSGEAFDWFTDRYGIDGLKDVHVAFWPEGGTRFNAEKNFQLNGYHFWKGTAQFPDHGPNGWPGGPTLPELVKANHAYAKELGARLFFETEALQLVMDGDAVAGVVARTRQDGRCVKFLARKGVILAAGDFSGNREMMMDLVTDVGDLLPDGQEYPKNRGRKGIGIQMGVWAGGRLEPRPIPVMGGNYANIPGVSSFGVLWLDRDGNRFCNELFGGTEIVGFAYNQDPKGTYFNVFDERVMEDLQWSIPAHGGFDEADPRNPEAVRRLLQKGRDSLDSPAAKEGVHYEVDGFHFPWHADLTFCGRTPQELVDNAGLTGRVAQNVIRSIRRYNDVCRAGRDEDFGKDAKVLRPLEGLLYIQPVEIQRNGFTMATVGGLVTDGEQNVLNDAYERIEGLYATWNCCGRRFGAQYSTPISGISIGIALTLGREVGRTVAAKKV